ncbi:MAG TPA: sugar ABC transporter permease, partial [Spirochaetia bacterium]|nr:sugar ABC transporter permease [Spirochaetia bacterium]
YEAARIDGASHVRILLQIVLPIMRPAFTFVMVTSLIGGLQMFELTFLVFPNVSYGPGGVAKTLIALIYSEAFAQDFRIGYASALGWMTFIIIFAISLVQLRLLGLGRAAEE